MYSYSIIYAFSRMIEYHRSKDDTLSSFFAQTTRKKAEGEIYLFDQVNYPREFFFIFFKKSQRQTFYFVFP